jgi:hypothetical protein
MEEVANEVRVKDEPICHSQSISDKANSQNQSINQEKQSIPISDSKPTKNQTNKRKRQLISANKVEKEPIDIVIDMTLRCKHLNHVSRSEEVEISRRKVLCNKKIRQE